MPATAAVALANMVLPVPGGPLYCVNQEIQISHWLDSNNNAANNDHHHQQQPTTTSAPFATTYQTATLLSMVGEFH